MDVGTLKADAARVVTGLGGAPVPLDWSGCDAVWPALEAMAADGAVVVVKIDGERRGEDDTGRYTVLVSGGPLGEEFFRTDTPILEEGLAQAILHYAERCWR